MVLTAGPRILFYQQERRCHSNDTPVNFRGAGRPAPLRQRCHSLCPVFTMQHRPGCLRGSQPRQGRQGPAPPTGQAQRAQHVCSLRKGAIALFGSFSLRSPRPVQRAHAQQGLHAGGAFGHLPHRLVASSVVRSVSLQIDFSRQSSEKLQFHCQRGYAAVQPSRTLAAALLCPAASAAATSSAGQRLSPLPPSCAPS